MGAFEELERMKQLQLNRVDKGKPTHDILNQMDFPNSEVLNTRKDVRNVNESPKTAMLSKM